MTDASTLQISEAKPKAKSKPAQITDPLVSRANEIENLPPEAVLEKLPSAIDNDGWSAFELGGLLGRVYAYELYRQVKGPEGKPYDSFRAYVEGALKMQYQRARHYVRLYDGLVEANRPWEEVSDLGWSKLKLLGAYLSRKIPQGGCIPEEEVDEVIAAAKKMNVAEYEQHLRDLKIQVKPGSTPIKGMSLRFHEDQRETVDAAIEKAEEETGKDSKEYNLEMICTAYLNGGQPTGDKHLKSLMQHAGIIGVGDLMDDLWGKEYDITICELEATT